MCPFGHNAVTYEAYLSESHVMCLLVGQDIGDQGGGLDIATVPPRISRQPDSNALFCSQCIDALPAGETVDSRLHRRIRKRMGSRCNPAGDLEIDNCTLSTQAVSLYKLSRNLLKFRIIIPDDPGLVKAAPQPRGMAAEIKKIASVPADYFINTVSQEETPVVRTDHCLVPRDELSVKKNLIHILKTLILQVRKFTHPCTTFHPSQGRGIISIKDTLSLLRSFKNHPFRSFNYVPLHIHEFRESLIMTGTRRLPSWLRMERASGESYTMVKKLVESHRLHTICTSGNCPNIGECWNAGTATLMILGDICTRSCKFCGTKSGRPIPPDTGEPERVAQAVKTMHLRHCVITSVDRDDLPDGGSAHWAQTIRRIKEINPGVTIETLIPDFRGNTADIDRVINAGPDVISHNIETVRRLTPLIRSVAKYEVSLAVLRHIASRGVRAKSGIMLGLGETEDEVNEALKDLFATGCRIVTIGQYLAPSLEHMPVVEYVTPEKFEEYRKRGFEIGFEFVESSPLVRSSFHAEKHVQG